MARLRTFRDERGNFPKIDRVRKNAGICRAHRSRRGRDLVDTIGHLFSGSLTSKSLKVWESVNANKLKSNFIKIYLFDKSSDRNILVYHNCFIVKRSFRISTLML